MGGDNKSFIEFIIQNLEMIQQLHNNIAYIV